MQIFAAGFLVGLAAVSISFGYLVIPRAWEQRSLDRISKRIIAHEAYNEILVQSALSKLDDQQTCWPIQQRAAGILELRLLELAIARGDRLALDQRFVSFRTAVVHALKCSPADAFLWFALYWVDVSQNGLGPKSIKYLEASYRYGTFEGWVQVKRNRYALAIFDRLSPAAAASVVLEYATLLASGFVTEAAANLAGPGLPIRDRLLASIDGAALRYRTELFKTLRKSGIDVAVPGVQIEARPWN